MTMTEKLPAPLVLIADSHVQPATEREDEFFQMLDCISSTDCDVFFLGDNLDLWKRKEFHDFEYLGRNLSLRETILYWGATLLLTALCVAICVGIGK